MNTLENTELFSIFAAFQSPFTLGEPNVQWQHVRPQRFIIADIDDKKTTLANMIRDSDFLTQLVDFILAVFNTGKMHKNFGFIMDVGKVSIEYENTYTPTPIYASLSQSNEAFVLAKGKQSVAIVYMVLACAQFSDMEWKTDTLDPLLFAGSKLYLYRRELSKTPHRRHLKPYEFNSVKYREYTFTTIVSERNDPCETLDDFLSTAQSWLDNDRSVSFSVDKSYYGIFKRTIQIRGVENKAYHLFDPRGIFDSQLSAKKPKEPKKKKARAILLEFDDLESLVYHVYRTLFAWKNSITPVQMKQMQFSPVQMYAYSIMVDTKGITRAEIDITNRRTGELRISTTKRVGFWWGKLRDSLA